MDGATCKLEVGIPPLHTTTERLLSISESTAERYTLADPDVRLMLQVRDNDAQAFEELMLRYQNRVLSLLAHLVGSARSGGGFDPGGFSARVPGAEAVRAGSEVFDVVVYDRGQRGFELRCGSKSRRQGSQPRTAAERFGAAVARGGGGGGEWT